MASGPSRRKTSAPPSSRDADLPGLLERLRLESGPDALDQRRALLLQCQLAQLERQLLVLNEAAAGRREVLSSLRESCERLLQLCRSAMAQEIRGPVVPVERSKLIAIIERCTVLQGLLAKEVDDLLDDRLHLSSLLPNRYSRGNLKLRDLLTSSQGLTFLNLSRVRALEGQLVTLFKALLQLSSGLTWLRSNSLATRVCHERFERTLSTVLSQLPAAAKEVGELGLLVPSLPTVTSPNADLGTVCTADDPRRFLREVKSAEARTALEGHLKALRQRVRALETKNAALEAELQAREAAASSRTAAADAVLEGLRSGASAFRNSLKTSLLAPFEAVMAAYEVMEANPDNRRLKEFLSVCQEHFPMLRISLAQLDVDAAAGDVEEPLFAQLRAALQKQLQQDGE